MHVYNANLSTKLIFLHFVLSDFFSWTVSEDSQMIQKKEHSQGLLLSQDQSSHCTRPFGVLPTDSRPASLNNSYEHL